MRQMGFGDRGLPWWVSGARRRGWRAHRKGAPIFLCMALCVIAVKGLIGGCDGRQGSNPPGVTKHGSNASQASSGGGNAISLPDAEQRVGTAVAILIDTSGSMEQRVPSSSGGPQQKCILAQEALRRIVDYTGQWQKSHTDRILNVGIYRFSSSPVEILPMGEFKVDQANTAVNSIGLPGGGTAIGDALVTGFKALYQSGCIRKHLVCITDGENTVGPRPDRIAQQLFAQTKGEVELHFVAFDTSAKYFGFLNKVNGHVVEAADGAQLQAKLSEIYEKRILAEQMPAEK